MCATPVSRPDRLGWAGRIGSLSVSQPSLAAPDLRR
jgi:hypothetical protein